MPAMNRLGRPRHVRLVPGATEVGRDARREARTWVTATADPGGVSTTSAAWWRAPPLVRSRVRLVCGMRWRGGMAATATAPGATAAGHDGNAITNAATSGARLGTGIGARTRCLARGDGAGDRRPVIRGV